jgi:peroxiredoxin
MTLQVGDRAPDLTLATPDGQPVCLAEAAWRSGRTALLVFLRHLG